MRQERTVQATIFEVFAQHEIGCELRTMSQWLDGQRGLISLVTGDLRRQGVRETGRRGLPAESVLRCALLKQQRQLSYEELAFHLEDSASFRAFARLPLAWSPKKSVLHHTIAAIRAETWEAINQALLVSAKQDRLESGVTVRLDSTVTAALMHQPSDSSLLSDAVRVMTRLLDRAEALPGVPAIRWRDRRRLAKKRARAIEYSRGQDKKRPLYRDLIAAAEASRDELLAMAAGLTEIAEMASERWRAAVDHYLPLIERVITQSRRRVLDGEAVPAGEKLVSLFEPHADIILKGGRQVQYGHKLNLMTGKSGLILDIVIEAGNPADRERFLPMLDRHITRTGCRQGSRDHRRRLPQEMRHRGCRHGQKPLGVPPPAQLPRRHRGGDLMLQAGLWRRPLHLARSGTLQGLHLVCRGGPQLGAVRPPQTSLADPLTPNRRPSAISPTQAARDPIPQSPYATQT
jgi:IS5 family transposase